MTAPAIAAACDPTYVHGLLVGGAIGFVLAFALSAVTVLCFWVDSAPDPDDAAELARPGTSSPQPPSAPPRPR